MGTYIKVCGLTNTEDAIMASKLNVNAIGFNFADSFIVESTHEPRKIIKKLEKTVCL